MAAASIGQVHRATLINGNQVVVKIQYPEVEEFFDMDVLTVNLSCKLFGMGDMDNIMKEFTKSFV